MVVVIVGSRYHAGWHVCDTELARTGKDVHVCHPYAVADLFPILLVVALLLLPEVDELGLPGIGTLKRRVAQQEREVERLGESINVLQQLSIRSSAEVTVTNNLLQAQERIAEKSERYVAASTAGAEEDEPVPAEPPRLSQAAVGGKQLLRSWGQIEAWLDLARCLEESDELAAWIRMPPGDRDVDELAPHDRHVVDRLPADLVLSAAQQRAVVRWSRLFADEIDSVRFVRNEVAHDRRWLKLEDIDRALDVAEQLLGLLQDGIASGPNG
jgi:hypothetical protein